MQRLEVSGAVRPLYWSLGVKGLRAKNECKTKRNSVTISIPPRDRPQWTHTAHLLRKNIQYTKMILTWNINAKKYVSSALYVHYTN